MEPQVKYARTSDGVNIAWFAMGSGPAYVWASAGPGASVASLRMPEFREMADAIARRATLVTYDSRGFGMSDLGPTDPSCEARVRDLEAVVAAASLERFTLQAFGPTAIPAIVYAARHPERVAALLLLNGIMSGEDMSTTWRHIVRLAEDDWAEAKAWLARTNMAGYAETATLEQLRGILDQSISREAFLAHAAALVHWDATESLSSVTVPTLVTHYGSTVPFEACRRLAASLPNATFVPIEPAQGERIVDAATRVIVNFLRGVLPRDPGRARQTAIPSGTAVIFFADIVDSTVLTERLGDAAFREKARDLDGALRTIIRDNGGSPIDGKLLGDGVLATFTSASQAIAAAVACGKAGEDGGLPLHLGLHAGDVIREDNNVFGGAVNVAARISGLSAPGEVLVSDTVRSLARTSAGVAFEDRGEQALKGVGEAVRVFRVVQEGAV